MRALIACLAFTLPTTAFAECPAEKSNLDSGIYLTSDSTESIRFRRDSQGHVLVESFPMGDFAFSYLATTMYGIYQLQEGTAYRGETMPDSLASMTYAVPSGNLPEPSPGLAFHSPVQFSGDADADPAAEAPVMFVTVGRSTEKSFGDCSYEALPVMARMSGPSEDYIARLDYIPKLGIAVEWMNGTFADLPQIVSNPRLSLTAPEGMPP